MRQTLAVAALCALYCGAGEVSAFSAAPGMHRRAAGSHAFSGLTTRRRSVRPLVGSARLQMSSGAVAPAQPYAQVLSAVEGQVAPKWDDGAAEIFAAMEDLKTAGVLTRWNSATLKSRAVTQGQIKTDKNLDEVLGLVGEVQDADLKTLTVGAFAASAIIGVGGSIIGGDTGGAVYWVTYLGAGIPLGLIAVGSVAPGLIGGTIAGIKWKLDPTNTEERRVRHEAAHMLCGYLCGLPLAGYDAGEGAAPQCEFFDRRDGNYDDGKAYEKKRAFTMEEVERIAVTALGGLMGELQFYDKADGGTGDLEQLQEVFFRSDAEKLRKAQAREEMTRWGAYTSKNLIDDYRPVYDKLIAAMERGASVEECIATIESA